MRSVTLHIPQVLSWDDPELYALCEANQDQLIEREPDGRLMISTPPMDSDARNLAYVNHSLWNWHLSHRMGFVFDQSSGFVLENGAMRRAGAAWISAEKWMNIPEEPQGMFPKICPDFVVELRTEQAKLPNLLNKMQEWMQHGCQLAWLIDPLREKITVFEANGEIMIWNNLDTVLDASPLLNEFTLDFTLLE